MVGHSSSCLLPCAARSADGCSDAGLGEVHRGLALLRLDLDEPALGAGSVGGQCAELTWPFAGRVTGGLVVIERVVLTPAFPTERRWNRTIQPEGCSGLPALKAGWATRPLPLRGDRSRRGVEGSPSFTLGGSRTVAECALGRCGAASTEPESHDSGDGSLRKRPICRHLVGWCERSGPDARRKLGCACASSRLSRDLQEKQACERSRGESHHLGARVTRSSLPLKGAAAECR